jgi:hypothetical protein
MLGDDVPGAGGWGLGSFVPVEVSLPPGKARLRRRIDAPFKWREDFM